ncbi:MAG: heavy metal translocating P-type ATPase [Ignavibacteria bacterium]|nr:heavy metal translocating P-type ATPase [Ignavibacteria bacterium]
MTLEPPSPTAPAVCCTHCGEPCADHSISDGAHTFCCTGCRSVYDILSSNGMCEYYTFDGASGVPQRGPQRDRSVYEVLDDAATAARFIDFSNGSITRARLALPGMHCASCVWLLEQLQRFDQGIRSSRVDLMRKTVEVEYDPSRTGLKAIAILLSSLGYEPLLSSEGTEHDRDAERREATRKIYLRLGVAGFAAGNVMMISIARYMAGDTGMDQTLVRLFSLLSIGLSIPVYFFSASPWLSSALASLRRRVVNLDVPVALGITTLFVRSIVDIVSGGGEGFLDSFAGLVFFLLIGRLFQQKAFDAVSFDRTVRSFFPLSVRREQKGVEAVVPIDAVRTGDVMIVRNGEVIPADAVLMSATGYVDYSFVTGESVPVECTSGSMIYAGGKVVGTAVRLTATRPVSQSYLASLWERTASRTPRSSYMKLSDRFGLWFTVGTLLVAAAGALFWLPNVALAVNVFTAVLIIACPCALTLAAPITLGTAMGLLGRSGMYIKNIGVLLELKNANTVVFDKTGTLTSSRHDVVYHGKPLTASEHEAIEAVASHSAHPVSQSIARMSSARSTADVVVEDVGRGVRGRSNGHTVVIGSFSYLSEELGDETIAVAEGTAVAVDGMLAGRFVMRSHVREDVPMMVHGLRSNGIQTRLVTGDTDRDADVLRSVFADEEMHFRATPGEKVEAVEALRSRGASVLMVGDGLNDVSAMAAADVSIAVTDETSTLAPASDLVMPAQRLSDLPGLLTYTHELTRVISSALWFTMAYNAVGISLALAGILTPVITAIMMPLSSLLVVGMSVGGARLYARRFK